MGQKNGVAMITGRLTEVMGRLQTKTGRRQSYRTLAHELKQLAVEIGLSDHERMSKDWLRLFDNDELVLLNKYNLELLYVYFKRHFEDITLDDLLWKIGGNGR